MSARDLPSDLLASVWQHLPVPLRLNIRRAVAKGLEAMKTPEPLDADQWAERHFYLSAESSQGEKRWQSYPPQRAMLGAMGDDDIAVFASLAVLEIDEADLNAAEAVDGLDDELPLGDGDGV